MKRTPCRRIVSSVPALVVVSALTLPLGQQDAFAYTIKSTFPRLAGIKNGAPQAYDDPAMQAKLAKLDVIMIDFHRSWGTIDKIRSAAQAIKAKNPNLVMLDYTNLQQISLVRPAHKPYRDACTANNWWVYPKGTTGTPVAGDPNFQLPNLTNWAPKNAAGDRWNTWFAKDNYNAMWKYVPEIDGTFTDVFFWRPRHDADWNRDGVTDSPNDATVQNWYQNGMVAHVKQIKSLMPGKLVTGNIGPWRQAKSPLPLYDQLVHGGLLEHAIGAPWSVEGTDMDGGIHAGSWKLMMDGYRKLMAMTQQPKLVIFNMKGHLDDYKSFRYGFASTLMDNGYFDFSSGDGGLFSSVPWFDEYDLTGTRTTSWLGAAIDPPQTAAWQSGVYRRRFQNGMVLVNPRGNGDRTVNVGAGYKRFKGTQDPVHNNGQVVTTITLRDRDAIFLPKI